MMQSNPVKAKLKIISTVTMRTFLEFCCFGSQLEITDKRNGLSQSHEAVICYILFMLMVI